MARLTMGHIKLFRKIQEWEWYGDPIMVAFWVHLLVNANYEDKKWRGMEIKRGEFVTSLSTLASETGISVSQVRTCLNRMRDSKQITIVSTNKMTKITICNYDAYQAKCKDESQADSTQNDMPLDILRDNQIATMEEYKEGKTKEVKKERKKSSNEDKEKDAELLEAAKRIYNAYPASTVRDGKVKYTRNRKDEGRIVSLLKSKAYTEERLLSIIKRYVEEKQGQYLRNLEHFLNNIPDYPDESLFRQGSPEKEYDPASPENQVDPELRRMFAGRYKRP